jgi:hypothetical protein
MGSFNRVLNLSITPLNRDSFFFSDVVVFFFGYSVCRCVIAFTFFSSFNDLSSVSLFVCLFVYFCCCWFFFYFLALFIVILWTFCDWFRNYAVVIVIQEFSVDIIFIHVVESELFPLNYFLFFIQLYL